MKKIILFLTICLLSSYFLHAQISISQNDIPVGGDTLRISYSTDTLNPVPTDTNYTWDFSYLTPSSQWIRKFDTPLNFPTVFAIYFISTASLGEPQYVPSTIPVLNINLTNSYNFYKNAVSKFTQVGLGIYINAAPLPMKYTKTDAIYQFPEQYGKTDTSDSQYGTPIPGIGYYGEFIHRVNVADGWGTLKTPFGTFQTLRIKSTLTTRDTIADTSGIDFSFSRPTSYEYKWLIQGGKIPYLQVNATNVGGNPVVNTIMYRDSIRANIPQLGVNELQLADYKMQVYPTPANNYVVVQYELSNNAAVKIELQDIEGRTVCVPMNTAKQPSGKHLQIVNLSSYHLNNGVYFIHLQTEQGSAVKKIVISK